LIEFGEVHLERRLKHFGVFLLLFLSPHGEGISLHFNKPESPPTPEQFVPSLVKIGPGVLQKKSKIYVYRQTDA
jgi:hypothetical protein